MPKILAFSGSSRHGSWNRKLTHAAVKATREAGGEVALIDLADYPLPLYDGDLEAREGVPDNALRLKALFREHAGLLIASPEYNSSLSPLLKNALDWVSREWQGEAGSVPYRHKVAAIMSASPGASGGLRMLPHLRQVLNALGVLVLPGQFSLPHCETAFDAAGNLTSPARLQALTQELVETMAALSERARAE